MVCGGFGLSLKKGEPLVVRAASIGNRFFSSRRGVLVTVPESVFFFTWRRRV